MADPRSAQLRFRESLTPVLSGVAKRRWILIAGAATLAGLIVFGMRRPPATPVLAQDVAFADGNGRATTLAEFGGKVVLVNLWATWCLPCRKEMPTLDRLQAQLGGADFQVVTLSIDTGGAQAVRAFYQETGVQHLPVFVDVSGAAIRRLNAPGLPTTLLFDRNGAEIGRFIGPAEWDSPRIVEIIKNAIGQTRKDTSS